VLDASASDGKRRGRGRPRVDPRDAAADVHLRIPAKDFDALYTEAVKRRTTTPRMIRLAVRHFLATLNTAGVGSSSRL
jgi:hypothetical protein